MEADQRKAGNIEEKAIPQALGFLATLAVFAQHLAKLLADRWIGVLFSTPLGKRSKPAGWTLRWRGELEA